MPEVHSSKVQAPAPFLTASLDDILITEDLASRPRRKPNLVAESAALRTLARVMAVDPGQLLDTLLEISLNLCGAGTAGLSVLEHDSEGEKVFRWTNLAGALKGAVGGCTPRNFSPCGVTLDRNAPQLFSYPGRHFTYFQGVEPPIVEGLVVPLVPLATDPLGTIWIVSHDERHRFDAEDVRIMTTLAEFTSSSLRLARLLEVERRALREAQTEIAEREQAQGELLRNRDHLESQIKARTSALRRMAAHLFRSQDDERRRIARELHDSVGQYLVSLKMYLAALAKPLPKESLQETIANCNEAVDQCISETRTISYLLHPPLLDEAGFASAAQWYVEGFAQRSGIAINTMIPDDMPRLAPAIELTLFRVLQEGLTNVHRHSGSTRVDVHLKTEGETVMLTIRDFGRGIPQDVQEHFQPSAATSGVGLAGMRERVNDMGGTLMLESGNPGTIVRVMLPLKGGDEE